MSASASARVQTKFSESVSANVRKTGVPTVDVKVSGCTAKDYRKADIQAAVAATG